MKAFVDEDDASKTDTDDGGSARGKGKQRRVTDFEFSTDEIAILKAKVGKWKTSGKSAREDIVDDMALEIAEKRGVQDKNLFAALLVKVR